MGAIRLLGSLFIINLIVRTAIICVWSQSKHWLSASCWTANDKEGIVKDFKVFAVVLAMFILAAFLVFLIYLLRW